MKTFTLGLYLPSLLIVMCCIVSCSTDIEAKLSEAEQLANDIEMIDQFLAERKIVPNIDPSGLRYVIFTQGAGPKPTIANNIHIGQSGQLFNGMLILNSAVATNVPVSGLMPGLKIGYQLLNKGTRANFYIPSGLGFGKVEKNGVPPNSNLIYEVELKDVY